MTHPAIHLDRDQEPWRGDFPGLGRVEVSGDGSYQVSAADPDRAERLRLAWAEPLSWLRRGYSLSPAAALHPPGGSAALLLHGAAKTVASVVLGFADHGWLVVSSFYTPLRWVGERLLAQPTDPPLSARRDVAARHRWPTSPGPDPSTSLVHLPRSAIGPVPVRGVLVCTSRLKGDPQFRSLAGLDRFRTAASLRIGLDSPESPAAEFGETQRLAQLPQAVFTVDGGTVGELTAVLDWWRDLR